MIWALEILIRTSFQDWWIVTCFILTLLQGQKGNQVA